MTFAVAFLLIGFAAGAINAAAGGGSLLTIALLIEFGLAAPVANATNRVAVLIQTMGSGARYRRDGILPAEDFLRLAPVSLIGAGIGAYIAATVPDEPFRKALAVLFAAIGTGLAIQVIRPSKWDSERQSRRLSELQLRIAVFGVGLYAGFIQAGVGLLMLLVLHIGRGMDVAKANALKVALIALWTLLALGIFWAQGLVRLVPGLWLGLGGLAGGWWGAGLVQRISPRVLRGAIALAVWIAALRFAT